MILAMASAMDESLKNVTIAMQDAGLWENTLLVFLGDNGGPTSGGHFNNGLRGG